MEETYKKYAAISMADGDSHESIGEFHFPKLKILLLKGSKPSSYPDDFFKRMRNLKVLVLKGMEFPRALPSSMALLKNLRTLHLQRCKLQNISVIGKLLNLVVLSLKVSTIKELSIEIGNLHHLKLLDLTNCYHLQNIPPNIIAKLSQLEGLYMLPNWWVHIERQVSWAELECLKFLRHFEVNVPTIEEWPCGLKVENLERFNVFIGKHVYQEARRFSKELHLCNTNIAERSIGAGLAYLVRHSEFLEFEAIKQLKDIAYDLEVDGFTNLKVLKVSNCNEIECIINTHCLSFPNAFPELKTLQLVHMKMLKEICHCGPAPPSSFDHLQEIILEDLPELENILCASNIPIPHSQSLVSEHASNDIEEEEEINSNDGVVMRSLKRLDMRNLPRLKCFLCSNRRQAHSTSHSAFFSDKLEFPSLKFLAVVGMQQIEELWHSAGDNREGNPTQSLSQLRELCLQDLPNLRHVWRHEIPKNSLSFQKLKKLRLIGCEMLKSLCQLSVPVLLPSIEEIEIKNCDKMEYVSYSCPDRSFPKLKNLILGHCKEMKAIILTEQRESGRENDGPNATVDWKSLKKLVIEECPTLKTIAQPSMNWAQQATIMPPLFTQKIEFPLLEILHVIDMQHIEELWHLAGDNGGGNPTKTFPQLSQLRLNKLPKMRHVWRQKIPESNPNFQILTELELWNCEMLESLFPLSVNVSLPLLGKIEIESCNKMVYIFNGCPSKLFPMLKELLIIMCKNIETVVSMEEGEGGRDNEAPYSRASFPSLHTLSLWYLPKLVSIVSRARASEWHSLESLHISNCCNLKTITLAPKDLSRESGIETPILPLFKKEDKLPSIKFLSLTSLEVVKAIWENQLLPGSFCQLETLSVKKCDKLVTVVPANALSGVKNLREITLWDCSMVEEIFIQGELAPLRLTQLSLMGLPNLKQQIQYYWPMFRNLQDLYISTLHHQKVGFSHRDFPHLLHMRRLRIQDSEWVEDLMVDLEGTQGSCSAGHPLALPSLQVLDLTNLPKLKRVPWPVFKGLRELYFFNNNSWQFLFSTSVATCLDQLKEITVSNCEKMENIIVADSEGEGLMEAGSNNNIRLLPRLELLNLTNLRCLRSIIKCEYAVEFPSLEHVYITGCENMQTFSTSPVTAPFMTEMPVDGNKLQIEDDLNAAIQQLYQDKQKGKQKVEEHQDPPPEGSS